MENTNSLIPLHIETSRLKFRLLSLEDINLWSRFINDYSSQEFLKVDPKDPQASEKWIVNQHRRYNSNLGGLMAIILKDTNEMIGQAGLLIQNIEGIDQIEVGYHLLPEFRKKGYASEAALGLINYVFDSGINTQVISLIHKNNIASQKVAVKNGLAKTSLITFHNFPVYVYKITKPISGLQED